VISRSLKMLFLFSIFGASAITLIGGWYTFESAPPYFSRVVGPGGNVLSTRDDIMQGQHAWQKYGLMDNGSVWGHGTYRGNDYSATTLHMIGVHMRDYYARRDYGTPYARVAAGGQGAIDHKVIAEIKQNREILPGGHGAVLFAAPAGRPHGPLHGPSR